MKPALSRTTRPLLLALLVSGGLLVWPVSAPAPIVLDEESPGEAPPLPEPVVRLDLVGAEVEPGEPPHLRVRVRPLTASGGPPSALDPSQMELSQDGRLLSAELAADDAGVISFEAAVERDGAEHEIGVRIEQGTARIRLAYPAPPGPGPALWLGVAAGLALAAIGFFAVLRRHRGGPDATSLTVLSGPTSGQVYRVAGRLRIGAIEGNDVVLDSPGVSRFHAEILAGPSGHEIRDLHSSNGTRVNGEPVQVAALRSGDKIQVADVELFFGT